MEKNDGLFSPSLAAALKKLHPEDGEQILDYLQTHVLLSQEKALLQASLRDQKKLLVENGKLKKDIEQLRTQLQEKQRRRSTKALLAPPPSEASQCGGEAATRSPEEPGEHQNRRRRRRREGKARPGADARPLEAEPRLDVSRLDLRVGRVLSTRRHPLAAALTLQEVDVGEDVPRPVASWDGGETRMEEGDLAVLLCNLKASKKRGVVSRARILRCCTSEGVAELLAPPPAASPGDRVTFLDYPGEPDKELPSKQTLWDVLQPDMRVDSRGVANYKGCRFQVKGKGLCRAPSLTSCTIR